MIPYWSVIIIICFVLYIYITRHYDNVEKNTEKYVEAEKRLQKIEPYWAKELSTEADEIVNIHRLRNSEVFQKILSEFMVSYIPYANFHMSKPDQELLYRVLKISTNEKLRDKIVEYLLLYNKEYEDEKKTIITQ
jgi:hypothetical protein